MKGLKKIPSIKQLTKAYSVLQNIKKEKILEKQLALYSQWSRLDPRLGEIMVQHLSWCWKQYHPIKLNSIIRLQAWPSALGVLLNHVPIYYQQKEKIWKEVDFFKKWSNCVMDSIPSAKNELFFINIYSAGSRFMYREAVCSTQIYKTYGFLGKELLINKAKSVQRTLIPAPQRKVILNELLKTKKTLTVREYLSELNFQIHHKQAQRDLKNHPKLKAYGNTKNKIYRKTKKLTLKKNQ